jgi:TPR repeat protein
MPYDLKGTTRKNPEKAEEWFKTIAREGTQNDKLFLAFSFSLGKTLNITHSNLDQVSIRYKDAFENYPPRQDGLTLETSQIFVELLKEDPNKVSQVNKWNLLLNPLQGKEHPHAQYYWAVKCMEQNNYEDAIDLLEKAKTQGLREAAYRLGIYYKQFFKGSPEDRLNGMLSNFTKAAKQGHLLAHSELGWLHETQEGGIKDPLASWAQAIAHYKYAALYGVKSAYEKVRKLQYLLKTSVRKRF